MNYREAVGEGLRKSPGLTEEQIKWAEDSVAASMGSRVPKELSEIEAKRVIMETIAMLRAVSRMPPKLREKMQDRLDATVAKAYPRN